MLSEYYFWIRTTHMTTAGLSIALFVLRGLWMLWWPARLQRGWVRVVPHVVDTLLLASAILLAVITWQYPGKDPWLTAKVGALIVYILLGTIALKRGRSRRIRVAAWVGAILTFAYIVAVATTRQVLPWAGV